MNRLARIAVINYGLGNLHSVCKAVERCGGKYRVAERAEDLKETDGIILPGVGAFDPAMDFMRRNGLDQTVLRLYEQGVPVLGICLGMQLLYQSSEEGKLDGLGLLQGHVGMFPKSLRIKIPQMGWNTIEWPADMRLFHGLRPGTCFYFVHSYRAAWQPAANTPSLKRAKAVYGEPFVAAIEHGHLWATQFHPEKSGADGLTIVRNFVKLCQEVQDEF